MDGWKNVWIKRVLEWKPIFKEAVAETSGWLQTSPPKAHILLQLRFPQEREPSFSFCHLQNGALKQGSGWMERGRGGRGIRPVNNPLHSVRANKNANAFERRDAIVRWGSAEVSGSLFSSSFFLFPPPTLLPSFVFSAARRRWWDRYGPKWRGLIELRRHDAESQWFITGDSTAEAICARLLQSGHSHRQRYIKSRQLRKSKCISAPPLLPTARKKKLAESSWSLCAKQCLATRVDAIWKQQLVSFMAPLLPFARRPVYVIKEGEGSRE